MNGIDVLLGLIVLLGVAAGWYRGFVLGAIELAMLAAGLLAAFAGHRPVADWLEARHPPLEGWSEAIAFLSLYVLVRLVLGPPARRLLRALPAAAHAHGVNRVLGTLPGLADGLIHATVATVLLVAVPWSDALTGRVRESRAVDALMAPAGWIESRLAPVFGEAAERAIGRLTVKPGSTESVRLPFTVASPEVREDLEARMLEMVNAERAKAGLRPLKADPELAVVARAHSRDMFARGYFAHGTPEGKDPFDRMRAGGVRFVVAGENLALARTLPLAHKGLMESPGHRANILKPAFGRVGIGVLDGGARGLMVTQNFRN